MRDLEHFYNAGFGWICRKCESESNPVPDAQPPRLLKEGEAESKNPRLSNQALARWSDTDRSILECPRCGVKQSLPSK
jgi:hypothetical protein